MFALNSGGDNLCGYSEKTDEKILINMKPQGTKGPAGSMIQDSGRKYDATHRAERNQFPPGSGLRLRRPCLRRQTGTRVS